MEEPQYKCFYKTYKKITFALIVATIYPNPHTFVCRLMVTPFILLSVVPLAFAIFIDMYYSWLGGDIVNIIRHCTVLGPFLGGFSFLLLSVTPVAAAIIIDMYYSWLGGDIVNIIRHCTVLGPFLAGFFKMYLMHYKRFQAKRIIDEMDRDYESYNSLPDGYKVIVTAGLKNSLVYSETGWVILVVVVVMTFPVMAVMQNIYSSLFTTESDPVKYMIHDLNKPFSPPEARFESPYFEIVFAYQFYCAVLYVIHFIGYDGFFGLTINHACLKIELFCKELEDALKRGTRGEILDGIVGVVKEQCRMFEFVNLIQDTFNIWFGLIFLATIIQICNCMYQISEGYGLDIKYMIFMVGTVVHIYLPCRYAAKLKAMSLDVGTKMYCSGWENVNDEGIRKMIAFMIARGQVPIQITAFNMMAFDMELFVSIIQSSYSLFTLLRS